MPELSFDALTSVLGSIRIYVRLRTGGGGTILLRARPDASVTVAWVSRFHWKLLAPGLIGMRGLYKLGMPLAKGPRPNLGTADGDARAIRGHAMTDADAASG